MCPVSFFDEVQERTTLPVLPPSKMIYRKNGPDRDFLANGLNAMHVTPGREWGQPEHVKRNGPEPVLNGLGVMAFKLLPEKIRHSIASALGVKEEVM